jgi:hypothetical protein
MAGFMVDTMAVGAWAKLSVIEPAQIPQRTYARHGYGRAGAAPNKIRVTLSGIAPGTGVIESPVVPNPG